MSYKLKHEEPVPEAIKRVVTDEIDDALELLNGAVNGGDRVKAVHDTRKNIKRMRAVLRLIGDELGRKVFAEENRFLRDTGRSLSEVRDAEVLIESFEKLASDLKKQGQIPARSITAARKILVKRRDESNKHVFGVGGSDKEAALGETIKSLEAAKHRVANWPIDKADRDTLTDGMHKSYKAGREAMNDAYKHIARQTKDPREFTPEEVLHEDELFHDWRKRVKDLWYHTTLVRPLWPAMMKQLAEEAHTLSDYLGDEHDLAVLQQTLAEHREELGAEVMDAIAQEIEVRREDLRRKAKIQGQRLYAEKPSAYILRIERYWRAWRD